MPRFEEGGLASRPSHMELMEVVRCKVELEPGLGSRDDGSRRCMGSEYWHHGLDG